MEVPPRGGEGALEVQGGGDPRGTLSCTQGHAFPTLYDFQVGLGPEERLLLLALSQLTPLQDVDCLSVSYPLSSFLVLVGVLFN